MSNLVEKNQISLFDENNQPIDANIVSFMKPEPITDEDQEPAADYDGMWESLGEDSPARNEHFKVILRNAKMLNAPISLPKHNCRECHGRGYTAIEKIRRNNFAENDSVDQFYDSPVQCSCMYSKEQLEESWKYRTRSRAERRDISKKANTMKQTILKYERGEVKSGSKTTKSKKKMVKASRRGNRK